MVRFGFTSYVALIGDVVSSRQIDERELFQRRLRQRLEAASQRYAAALVRPLVVLRGDEIQGLFRWPEAAVGLTSDLAEHLFPYRLVYGLGRGPLSTGLLPTTGEMDGPCFHLAREALEEAQKADAWLLARGFGPPADEVIGALFQLMDAVRRRWTERQTQFVRAARGELQKDVAARFEVSPSVVSESLKASCFAAVREGEEATASYLREFAVHEKTGSWVAEPVVEYDAHYDPSQDPDEGEGR